MKEFIAIALVFCFLALLNINDSIIEGSLSPEEKSEIKQEAVNEAAKLKAITVAQVELSNKNWDEVSDEEQTEWILFNILHSDLIFYVLMAAGFLSVLIFSFNSIGRARNGGY